MSEQGKTPATPNYALYEQLKRALPNDLTPKEYEAAVKKIARRCGI